MKGRVTINDTSACTSTRSATEFVQKASSFSSEIKLIKNERAAAGKSIMGVMSLAIKKGDEVTLLADGKDEQ